MRAGKVERLHEWLAARLHALRDFNSVAYSDSINDLPLLEAVDEVVAVDPDPRLAPSRASAAGEWSGCTLDEKPTEPNRDSPMGENGCHTQCGLLIEAE